MKKQLSRAVLATPLVCYATSTFSQIDRGGNVIEHDGGGGDLGFGTLVLVVMFFAGIYWFMTRFKSDSEGFAWLMAAVVLLIVVGAVSKCAA